MQSFKEYLTPDSFPPQPHNIHETMAIWHEDLDLSTIPFSDPDNLTLFDTYNIEDIEWYHPSPGPAPSNTILPPPNSPSAPSQKPSKQA